MNTASISSDAGAKPADLGGKPDASTTTPTEVEIKVGDKTVKVTSEVAQALEAARREASEAGVRVGSMDRQLKEVNSKLETLLKPAKSGNESPTGDTALDVLLFTDPTKAIAMIEQNIMSKVQNQANQQKAQSDFWREFYKENKDLNDAEFIVNAVWQREVGGYVKDNISVAETIKKLGEATKKEILKLRGPTPNPTKPAAEGGNEPGNSGKQKESETQESEKEPETTTASILAERREARRTARTSVGKSGKR